VLLFVAMNSACFDFRAPDEIAPVEIAPHFLPGGLAACRVSRVGWTPSDRQHLLHF
jgi:hypothetical protein